MSENMTTTTTRQRRPRPAVETQLPGEAVGTIEKRGELYYGRVNVDGKRPRVPLGRISEMSEARAREKVAALLETGKRDGNRAALVARIRERAGLTDRVAVPTPAPTGLTVAALAEKWWTGKLFEQHGDVNGPKLKKSADSDRWRFGHVGDVKVRDEATFGSLPVADVTEEDIDRVFATLPRNWRPATRAKVYAMLHRLFELAVSPCRIRRDNPVGKHHRPGKGGGLLFQYLYPDELLAVLKRREVPVGRRVLYALAIYTSLRTRDPQLGRRRPQARRPPRARDEERHAARLRARAAWPAADAPRVARLLGRTRCVDAHPPRHRRRPARVREDAPGRPVRRRREAPRAPRRGEPEERGAQVSRLPRDVLHVGAPTGAQPRLDHRPHRPPRSEDGAAVHARGRHVRVARDRSLPPPHARHPRARSARDRPWDVPRSRRPVPTTRKRGLGLDGFVVFGVAPARIQGLGLRLPHCGSRCRGFDSRYSPQVSRARFEVGPAVGPDALDAADLDVASFAAILKQARMDAGVSQSELARRMGVAQPAVSKIEKGEHPTLESTVLRYAAALGLRAELRLVPFVPVAALLDFEVEKARRGG